jgi:transposase
MILCSENTHQYYPTNEGVVSGTATESLRNKRRYWHKEREREREREEKGKEKKKERKKRKKERKSKPHKIHIIIHTLFYRTMTTYLNVQVY